LIEENPSPLEATIAERLQQLYIKAKASGETGGVETQVFQETMDQDQIHKALVALIVVRNLPFRIIEWPEFHIFCRLLNPHAEDSLVTAHSTVPKLIGRSWVQKKDLIRKKIQSAISNIHVSLDIWTSPNRLLLLGICGHFVDRQKQLRKSLLALRPVASHSGQEQFQTFLPVLQEYGFSQKLGAIISDNASTNDTLCRAIHGHLEKVENIEWDDSLWRLRCIGHIINLAVEAFLFQDLIEKEDLGALDQEEAEGKMVQDSTRTKFRKIGPLGRLHNIVVHIRSSPSSRRKQRRALAARRQDAGMVPFHPGAPLSPMRWDGTLPPGRPPLAPGAGTVPFHPGAPLSPGRWFARASALPSEVFYSPPGGVNVLLTARRNPLLV